MMTDFITHDRYEADFISLLFTAPPITQIARRASFLVNSDCDSTARKQFVTVENKTIHHRWQVGAITGNHSHLEDKTIIEAISDALKK